MAHISKKQCLACGRQGVPMNKEHVFPAWLIERTNTANTQMRWVGGGRVPPHAMTIPLCEDCNTAFGAQLEAPVRNIFDRLETGRGMSIRDGEILIRWLWKTAGLSWCFEHPSDGYTFTRSLRERALLPIDDMLKHLVLCVALIQVVDKDYGDAPLGIDSKNELDAMHVAGVFSKVALMVVHEPFAAEIPEQFTQIRFDGFGYAGDDASLIFPPTSFRDDTDAVGVTSIASARLSYLHDELAREVIRMKRTEDGKV